MLYAFLLVCAVTCIEATIITLSPAFNEVLENSTLELTCSAPKNAIFTKWSTLNHPESFSTLTLSNKGLCATSGFLADDRYYETTCNRNALFKVKIKHVNISNHGNEWYCTHKYVKSNYAVISVEVPTKYVRIKNIQAEYLMVVENVKTSLSCETSEGRPAANITWIKISKTGIRTDLTNDVAYQVSTTETISERNLIVVTSSVDIEPERADDDARIICEATNRKLNTVRKEIKIKVQYSPSKPKVVVDERITLNDSLRLISGNNLSVRCESDSYPYPTYTWITAKSEYSGQYLNLTNLTSNETIRCTATNNMTLPNKTVMSGNNFAKLNIHVLFPTSKPVLYFENGNYALNETLYAIRNDDVTLLCRSDGDPAPKYQWTGESRLGARLDLESIQTNAIKTCITSNKMSDTLGEKRASFSNTSVAIVVSYPPRKPYFNFSRHNDHAKDGIYLRKKVSVEESSSFTVTCEANGYPPPTCTWNRSSNSSSLTFMNISKESSGLYRCFAENTIKRSFPTFEAIQKTSADLEVDVLYQSRIVVFYIVELGKKGVFEVTENETIIFNCTVDSNPESSIALYFRGKELKHGVSTKALIHTHRVASYRDDGIYKCVAQNIYNNKPSIKELNLHVKCKPRMSPDIIFKSTVVAARNRTVSFEFKAIANPTPGFHWFKFSGSIWTLLRSSDHYEIHISELYSNLSVISISDEDYGRYRLRIQNEVGSFEQLYFLKEIASPSKLYFTLSEKRLVGKNRFTVARNEEVSLMCFSDSDVPFDDIAISMKEGDQIAQTISTTSVRHTIERISCNDAGEYICLAKNMSTLQQEEISNLILMVQCPPQPSTKNKEDDTIFTSLHSDAIMRFEVQKYFDESNNTVFIWYKQNSSLQNDGRKFIISSKGFQSNLVIRRIAITDLGQYRILVRNSYGVYIHFLNLQEKEPESTTTRTILAAVGTFGFTILAVVLVLIGSRHFRRFRREQNERQTTVDQSEEIEQEEQQHIPFYEEIDHVYELATGRSTEGAVYIEMRDSIKSEDSTKYYLTPTI